MKMTAGPVAYIRRSARSRSDPGDLSREFQTETVRQLAGDDGPSLAIIDQDWGRSAATDKTDQRLAFLALLENVERGDLTAIYAYSTDRLARSVEWSARLLNACRRAGTVIVTSEGRFEPDNDMTDQLFYFQAMQNEGYSRQAKRKRDATVARLRARGEKMGPPFYGALPGESVDVVLATFDEAGSANRTAWLLNERHVPTRRGKPWTHATVRQILIRADRYPKLVSRGAKPRASFRLSRLLRCHCGRMLSGVRHGERVRKSDGGRAYAVIYRCVQATSDPSHGVKSVSEARLMAWIMAEADSYVLPLEVERTAAAAKRSELETRRERVADMYESGTIERDDYLRRVTAVDRDLESLEDEQVLEEVGPIDWQDTPVTALNAQLRAYWREVQLDAAMRPIEADWRIARMRN